MRLLSPSVALAAALLALPAAATPVSFVRVWPRWTDATPFSRISEYFTGRENLSGRIVQRTHPEVRPGFYFLVRVKNPGPLIPATKFVLQILEPGSPLPRTYAFTVDMPAGGKVCDLGLTGSDWPDKAAHPIAWKLDLLDSNGNTLAEAKSFLWSKP